MSALARLIDVANAAEACPPLRVRQYEAALHQAFSAAFDEASVADDGTCSRLIEVWMLMFQAGTVLARRGLDAGPRARLDDSLPPRLARLRSEAFMHRINQEIERDLEQGG